MDSVLAKCVLFKSLLLPLEVGIKMDQGALHFARAMEMVNKFEEVGSVPHDRLAACTVQLTRDEWVTRWAAAMSTFCGSSWKASLENAANNAAELEQTCNSMRRFLVMASPGFLFSAPGDPNLTLRLGRVQAAEHTAWHYLRAGGLKFFAALMEVVADWVTYCQRTLDAQCHDLLYGYLRWAAAHVTSVCRAASLAPPPGNWLLDAGWKRSCVQGMVHLIRSFCRLSVAGFSPCCADTVFVVLLLLQGDPTLSGAWVYGMHGSSFFQEAVGAWCAESAQFLTTGHRKYKSHMDSTQLPRPGAPSSWDRCYDLRLLPYLCQWFTDKRLGDLWAGQRGALMMLPFMRACLNSSRHQDEPVTSFPPQPPSSMILHYASCGLFHLVSNMTSSAAGHAELLDKSCNLLELLPRALIIAALEQASMCEGRAGSSTQPASEEVAASLSGDLCMADGQGVTRPSLPLLTSVRLLSTICNLVTGQPFASDSQSARLQGWSQCCALATSPSIAAEATLVNVDVVDRFVDAGLVPALEATLRACFMGTRIYGTEPPTTRSLISIMAVLLLPGMCMHLCQNGPAANPELLSLLRTLHKLLNALGAGMLSGQDLHGKATSHICALFACVANWGDEKLCHYLTTHYLPSLAEDWRQTCTRVLPPGEEESLRARSTAHTQTTSAPSDGSQFPATYSTAVAIGLMQRGYVRLVLHSEILALVATHMDADAKRTDRMDLDDALVNVKVFTGVKLTTACYVACVESGCVDACMRVMQTWFLLADRDLQQQPSLASTLEKETRSCIMLCETLMEQVSSGTGFSLPTGKPSSQHGSGIRLAAQLKLCAQFCKLCSDQLLALRAHVEAIKPTLDTRGSTAGAPMDVDWETERLSLQRMGCCYSRCTSFSGASEAELKVSKCSGCRRAWYCSQDCQKLAWPSHKAACRRMQHS